MAVAMGSNKRFKVHLGGTVDHDHLFSLRQEDVLPLHKNRVTVQVGTILVLYYLIVYSLPAEEVLLVFKDAHLPPFCLFTITHP